MENVSKALIVAGGTLIAILIISIGVAISGALQGQAKTYYETLSTQEISKINHEITKDFAQTFIKDGDKKNYITAQGIVTLKNVKEKLAKEGINITISGVIPAKDDIEILKNYAVSSTNNGKINYYVVEITSRTPKGMIEKIEIIGDTAKNKT